MNKSEIKQYMLFTYVYEKCVDPQTGELNMTGLAEDAAEEFDLYVGENCDIPEEVFELAFEVNQELIECGFVEP